MGEPLTDKALEEALVDLNEEFGEFHKLDGYWLAEFANSSRDVAQTIRRCDSDIHSYLLKRVYEEMFLERASKERNLFNVLEDMTYHQMWEMTNYGRMIVKIRYSLGYGGNMKRGQVLRRLEVLAMIFAYEAYWHFGDDFLLGSVVETFLQRLEPKEEWVWPMEKEFGGRQDKRQYQWMAWEIVGELKKVFRYHRLMAPGMENIRTADEPKPAFVNFRELDARIKEMVKQDRRAG